MKKKLIKTIIVILLILVTYLVYSYFTKTKDFEKLFKNPDSIVLNYNFKKTLYSPQSKEYKKIINIMNQRTKLESIKSTENEYENSDIKRNIRQYAYLEFLYGQEIHYKNNGIDISFKKILLPLEGKNKNELFLGNSNSYKNNSLGTLKPEKELYKLLLK